MLEQVWNQIVFSLVTRNSLTAVCTMCWVLYNAAGLIHKRLDNAVLARKHARGTKDEIWWARRCLYTRAFTVAMATQFSQQLANDGLAYLIGTDVEMNGMIVLVVHHTVAVFVLCQIDWTDPADVKIERLLTALGHIFFTLWVWKAYFDNTPKCVGYPGYRFSVHGYSCIIPPVSEMRIDPEEWASDF